MAKPPRKNDIGWKHTIEPPAKDSKSTLWTVWGPSLEGGPCFCDSKDAAESVAAALNLALNYAAISRRAKEMVETLRYFEEFK